ncbi:MAG: ABC transporter ATP-binding protein/permease [Oscillospiraceae bacterium]|nr:ABC transporter ATP-binding protein/permease [Oscillospiraceae bacterium]
MKKHSALSNEIWLLKLLVKYEKWYPLLLAALIAAKLLLPLVSTLLPAAAVAALTGGGGMGQYLAVIVGLMVLYAGGTFLRDWLENRNLILRDNFRMEVCVAMVMEKAMTMDYGKLESAEEQKRLATAKNQAGNPMSGGVNELLYAVEPWLRSLLGILIYGTAAVMLDWRILLVLAGMTVANYAAASLVRRYEQGSLESQKQNYREQDYLNSQADKPANGKDVRLYRMEDWFLTSLRAVYRRRWTWRNRLFRRKAVGSVSDTLFLALRDILAYTVLISAFLAGQVDAAGFTFSLGVLSTLTAWLNEFIHINDNLLYYNIAFNTLRNFLDEDDAPPNGEDAKADDLRRPPRVELRDVTFTYPDAKAPTIDRLSLTLEPGEKIALVGLNGAGKTTLVKLLSGLYRPDSGEILIDGVPAEQFSQEEYFQLVGTVFQDVSLLPFTIGENLAGRENYDRSRVWESIGKAGLRETVENLPKGLDTHLTQQMEKDGVELSGGQRQRLSFARALYKDAPLLILDEPTAALDPLAEADLYYKYAQETADKTSVFISHRLGSTQFCDRVVYMDGGRITEMGSHRELLARGGAYARLFEVQSSWYKDEKEAEAHEEN